jgi:glycerol-3-phosphate dehydrogenase
VRSGVELERHAQGCGLAHAPAALRWFDAFAPRPRRLLLELVHRACDAGAVALNHCEAKSAIVARGRVEGVRVRDRASGTEHELRAPLVICAAGQASDALTGATSRTPWTVAWNVLLDVAPDFSDALAVSAPRPGAPVLFVVPWEGRLLAGTGHAGATGGAPEAAVPPEALAGFLADLAAALPGLDIREERVLRVYHGLLPGIREGSALLARRPEIVDHARAGGPRGLWSVSGVKLTTARSVAAQTLDRAGATAVGSAREIRRDPARLAWLRFGPDWRPEDDAEGLGVLRSMIADEAALHLDDLLLRRTCLGDDPRRARALAPALARWFGDDEATQRAECERLMRALEGARSPLS